MVDVTSWPGSKRVVVVKVTRTHTKSVVLRDAQPLEDKEFDKDRFVSRLCQIQIAYLPRIVI